MNTLYFVIPRSRIRLLKSATSQDASITLPHACFGFFHNEDAKAYARSLTSLSGEDHAVLELTNMFTPARTPVEEITVTPYS